MYMICAVHDWVHQYIVLYMCKYMPIVTILLHTESWYWGREQVGSVISLSLDDVCLLCNASEHRQGPHASLVAKHNVRLQTADPTQEDPAIQILMHKRNSTHTHSQLVTVFSSLTCLPQRVLGWGPSWCYTEYIRSKSKVTTHTGKPVRRHVTSITHP